MAYSVAYLNRSGIPITSDLEVVETANDEGKVSTNSAVIMEVTLFRRSNELPPVPPRTPRYEPATPCKTLCERINLFITGCVSRVKVFFAQRNFVSDFNRDTSVKNLPPEDQYLSAAWLNLLNNFFRNANVSDVEKLCHELGGKIKDAKLDQLERMADYISSLEGLARQNSLQEEPYVYDKFFTELSSALMSRSIGLIVECVVKSAYVEAKNNTLEDPISGTEKKYWTCFRKFISCKYYPCCLLVLLKPIFSAF